MQDIHSIAGGGGGRFFVAGDRRMRPHSYPNNNHIQGLKCPRCDSLNTKFCYYNNYNLSQPRHFCKSCRRYWTKGGVLRNVPVGGGCRKTKRVRRRSEGGVGEERATNAPSSSSAESSSLIKAVEEAPTVSESASIPRAYDFSESRFFGANPSFGNRSPNRGQMFSTEICGLLLPSLVPPPSSSSEMIGFDAAEGVTASFPPNEFSAPPPLTSDADDFKLPEMKGMIDGGADLPEEHWGSGDGGVAVQHGLFDLTAVIDSVYWNQSQWTDSDPRIPSVSFPNPQFF